MDLQEVSLDDYISGGMISGYKELSSEELYSKISKLWDINKVRTKSTESSS